MRKLNWQPRSLVLLGSVFAAAVVASACSESQTTSFDPQSPAFSVGFIPGPGQQAPFRRQAEVEAFEVCKDYSGGTSRDPVTIEVLIAPHEGSGPTPNPFTVELDDGECWDVWNHGGSGQDVVTVTENPVPDGYTVSYVKTVVGPLNSAGSGTNGASGIVNGFNGVLVEFTNTIIPTEFFGCTPGFWKNNKKPKDWTAPLHPDAMFTAAGFTSPGARARVVKKKKDDNVVYQLQALNANQGDLAALTRHAMAALLNATSPAVDYEFSAADIVTWYNQAVAGTYAGTIEDLKNMLAAANEQGCPLDNSGKRDRP
jgi:hypothetical protein